MKSQKFMETETCIVNSAFGITMVLLIYPRIHHDQPRSIQISIQKLCASLLGRSDAERYVLGMNARSTTRSDIVFPRTPVLRLLQLRLLHTRTGSQC